MPTTARLTPLLALASSDHQSLVEYEIGGTTLRGTDRDTAAQLIADDAMVVACGSSAVLVRWRQRRDGGQAQTGARLRAAETFVNIGFGLPGQPNDIHLQGHVAELLWNRVLKERKPSSGGRALVASEPVKSDPLEPGGDGLVVYTAPDGTYVFRLWEIKKHDAASRVSDTINRARKQLTARGNEYLAKLAGPAPSPALRPLAALYD